MGHLVGAISIDDLVLVAQNVRAGADAASVVGFHAVGRVEQRGRGVAACPGSATGSIICLWRPWSPAGCGVRGWTPEFAASGITADEHRQLLPGPTGRSRSSTSGNTRTGEGGRPVGCLPAVGGSADAIPSTTMRKHQPDGGNRSSIEQPKYRANFLAFSTVMVRYRRRATSLTCTVAAGRAPSRWSPA